MNWVRKHCKQFVTAENQEIVWMVAAEFYLFGSGGYEAGPPNPFIGMYKNFKYITKTGEW